MYNLNFRVIIVVMKSKTIDSFFKKKNVEQIESDTKSLETTSTTILDSENNATFASSNNPPVSSSCELRPSKIPRLKPEAEDIDLSSLERDPGLRKQINEYPVNQRVVLDNISADGSNFTQCAQAHAAHDNLTFFEFVFILHLMKEIIEITDSLCQALQRRSQDILNAMDLVSSTKKLIREFRETGWDTLFMKVRSFCELHEVNIPDMNAIYSVGRGSKKKDDVTMDHHYRIDIFVTAIDSQLQKLNSRFDENMVELLILSSALDPKYSFKSFSVDKICSMVSKFYPEDFTEQEQICLPYKLQHYAVDIFQHPNFGSIFTLSELCQRLAETGKAVIYPLVDRLIRLVLTLPVSTATIK
ncbi:hypothetical protein CFOL_v3_28519 [Cephalotus follicularis]|uniref:Uncharacterized protein n=1 Tax=Cephalotus follicularis TaxID=3775 RepID=A0A1Q3CXV7_CEPFO|nr:hypothetical protein CFOL_v3_28519 [Cephalotus follicularis]